MKCPACAAEVAAGPDECPACGVNFAKWKAKVERQAAAAGATPPDTSPAPAPPSALPKAAVGLAAFSLLLYAGYDLARRHLLKPDTSAQAGVLARAEPYREHLKDLEAAVYRAGPPTAQDAEGAAHQAAQVAGMLLQDNPENPFIHKAVGDLTAFAGLLTESASQGSPAPMARLEWMRAWESLRAKRFERAPWFHPATTARPGAAADFEKAATGLLSTSHALRALLASLRPELETFGDGAVDLRSAAKPADAPRLEAWRAWVPGWQGRVDKALSSFPGPDEMPDELQYPYEALVRAAQSARNPPNPGAGIFLPAGDPALNMVYLPGRAAREAWLKDLDSALDSLPPTVQAAREKRRNSPDAQQ